MPLGQRSTQSMQSVQASGIRPPVGSRASMRHAAAHWPHALQTLAGTRFTSDRRASSPNRAPAGQTYRHQNRRATNSRAKTVARSRRRHSGQVKHHRAEREQVFLHPRLQNVRGPAIARPSRSRHPLRDRAADRPRASFRAPRAKTDRHSRPTERRTRRPIAPRSGESTCADLRQRSSGCRPLPWRWSG